MAKVLLLRALCCFHLWDSHEPAPPPPPPQVATNTGGKEIRFRMTQGIAGEVARTQIPLNIRNVYADPRCPGMGGGPRIRMVAAGTAPDREEGRAGGVGGLGQPRSHRGGGGLSLPSLS